MEVLRRPWVAVLAFALVASGCEWTRRVSVDLAGGDANGDSSGGPQSISADGRYVAFGSRASDLVPGDGNGAWDVFVRDLRKGTTIRVSVDLAGGDANGESGGPSISADGRYVAFHSYATNLVPGGGNGAEDVFVRDIWTGATAQVSVDSAGGDANGDSRNPSISADGRNVAFLSSATDLVPVAAQAED